MFEGAHTALVTPFREREFDEPAFRELIERQLEGRISGLVPCGTTGESPTLANAEHRRVIEVTIEATAGRALVIAGTGSINFVMSAMLPGPNDGKVSVESTRIEGMDDFMTVNNSHHYITESDVVIINTTSFLQNGVFADSTLQAENL